MAPFHIQKHKMASLLRTLTDRFTPNASSTDLTATERRKDGFLTAKGTDALFQRTKAEIDGDDCLHDCESCTVSLPRKWAGAGICSLPPARAIGCAMLPTKRAA